MLSIEPFLVAYQQVFNLDIQLQYMYRLQIIKIEIRGVYVCSGTTFYNINRPNLI